MPTAAPRAPKEEADDSESLLLQAHAVSSCPPHEPRWCMAGPDPFEDWDVPGAAQAPYDEDELRALCEESWAEGFQEGRADGIREGTAEAVIRVMDSRGLTLASDAEEQVRACLDPELLRRWLHRSTFVWTARGLFEDV